MLTLAQHLEAVPDPRSASGWRHPFAAALKLTVLAMACGFRSLAAVAHFGRALDEAERRRKISGAENYGWHGAASSLGSRSRS